MGIIRIYKTKDDLVKRLFNKKSKLIMTPKEKAKELFDKIFDSDNCGIKHQPNHRYCDCTEINYFQAKQCALIAVDEIISHSRNTAMVYDLSFDESTSYWQEVKQEIEKL
jgi:hypothetical protein